PVLPVSPVVNSLSSPRGFSRRGAVGDAQLARLGDRLADARERLRQVKRAVQLLQQPAHTRDVGGVARVAGQQPPAPRQRHRTAPGNPPGIRPPPELPSETPASPDPQDLLPPRPSPHVPAELLAAGNAAVKGIPSSRTPPPTDLRRTPNPVGESRTARKDEKS